MTLKNNVSQKKVNWQNVFENFNSKYNKKKYNLKSLLIMAGHLKSKTGEYTVKNWLNEMEAIKKKICVKNGKILEIGCGTGALLKTFENEMKIFGVDYSNSMIEIASRAIPNGIFKNYDASKIKFRQNFFDTVVIFSCIQYFPDNKYLTKVLNKVDNVLKKNGTLYLGELVEKKKQNEFNIYRKKKLGLKEYKKKYLGKVNSNLVHYSVDRDEIYSLLKKNYKNIEILNSLKRGDEKEVFRFNVYCQKK